MRIEDYLTITEAAQRLGISRQAVHLAIEAGRLKDEIVLGKRVITKASVEHYQPMESRIQAGQAGAKSKKAPTRRLAKQKG